LSVVVDVRRAIVMILLIYFLYVFYTWLAKKKKCPCPVLVRVSIGPHRLNVCVCLSLCPVQAPSKISAYANGASLNARQWIFPKVPSLAVYILNSFLL
jgi:hypothetical protein